jgi:hypothetical protein
MLGCSETSTAPRQESAAFAIVGQAPSAAISATASTDVLGVPISDLGSNTYLGFQGGLYPDGTSNVPIDHATVGSARGRDVRPLRPNGTFSTGGKYVLLAIGMSNTSIEFCAPDRTARCDPTSFMGLVRKDSEVNHTTLVLVNGAQGSNGAASWDSPTDAAYDVVRDNRLRPLGLSERQVEIVWLKAANIRPTVALPSPEADAYMLERRLGDVVRALKVRYPNLRQVFLSSRIYAGYAEYPLNPEPFAYESGFSVKWLIQAQITQMQQGQIVDPQAGDLNHSTIAPWIAWGPYLWAFGTVPRSDGLKWLPTDFVDGTHPSDTGTRKVARLLLQFFKNSPQTRCWFVVGGVCQ